MSTAFDASSIMSVLMSAEQGELYAVLDGARDPAVHAFTREAGCPWVYIEDAVVEASYEVAAPRIVALGRRPSPALERLLAQGWGHSWGVFVRTKAGFGRLRRHLRTLSSVKLPNGRVAQFRFYDPRVLRLYLPTCTADEFALMFGPILEYFMEAEEPGRLCRFARIERPRDDDTLEADDEL
jgi:hypothetical protein